MSKMSKQEVIELMRSSQSEADWVTRAMAVQEAFDGEFPAWWREEIVEPRLADEVSRRVSQAAEARRHALDE